MNLKLALGAAGGAIIAVVGGCIIFTGGEETPETQLSGGIQIMSEDPDNDIDQLIPEEISEEIPPQVPVSAPNIPGKEMMVIPEGGSEVYGKVVKKYKGHFDRKIDWFVRSNYLSIPRKNATHQIRNIWNKRKGDMRKMIKDEFGEDVSDGQLNPDKAEETLMRAIFGLCSKGNEDRKGRHCVVDESDISHD